MFRLMMFYHYNYLFEQSLTLSLPYLWRICSPEEGDKKSDTTLD